MAWDVEVTDEFTAWYRELDDASRRSVIAAVEKLEESGPSLGRPFVDTIKTSRHANMKELRPLRGNIRVLFAFDPRRSAILLIGGDKSGRWQAWYRVWVPIADDLYDAYLMELRSEGLVP